MEKRLQEAAKAKVRPHSARVLRARYGKSGTDGVGDEMRKRCGGQWGMGIGNEGGLSKRGDEGDGG
eukprot:1489912-Rhodomonas_salina.1